MRKTFAVLGSGNEGGEVDDVDGNPQPDGEGSSASGSVGEGISGEGSGGSMSLDGKLRFETTSAPLWKSQSISSLHDYTGGERVVCKLNRADVQVHFHPDRKKHNQKQ